MLLSELPFHVRLRQLRKAHDLTQEMFAQQAGCAVSTIRKLEQGTLRPSRDLALHLARALTLAPGESEAFVHLARRAPSAAPARQALPPTPVSSADQAPSMLPALTTPFIGREAEIAQIGELFADAGVRLVTLTGPGGVGKTRLAIEVGAHLRRETAAGVFFVALASLTDPKLVAGAIAQTLQIHERGSRSAWEYLIDALRPRRMVLILDNFEHLIDAAHNIAALLQACPDLRILITSRSTLGMYGEHVFPIAPLPLPEPAAEYTLTHLAENAACALFIQRARATNPAFALTPATAPTIVEICRRLDGLPLALELAAARTRLLSAEALLARMAHRLDLLTTGPRTLDKRMQTLRGAIDWSYHLLDQRRRALFERMAVFAGGCDLAAIAAICYPAPEPEATVLDDLELLVGSSLVQQNADGADGPRFHLLEVLREYAGERLAASGSADAAQQHALYYRQLAEHAAPELVGAEQVTWLDRIERDHDNLRAALHWACTYGEAATALAIAASLGRFWWLRGYLSEGQRWLQLALAQHGGAPPPLRAEALYWAGILAIHQGDYIYAQATLADSLSLFQGAQAPQGIALALNALGVVANRAGNHALAQARYDQSLQIARASGNVERIATALNNLGYTLLLGAQPQLARSYLRESLALARSLHDTQGQAFALTNLGLVALAQKNPQRARRLLQASLNLFTALGDLRNSAEALEGLAEAALAEGDAASASRDFGTAAAYRDEIGAPLTAHGRSHVEALIEQARAQIGPRAFADAWAAGQKRAKTR